MTLYDYNTLLDINDRADVLWKFGAYIERYADVEYSYNLYSLFNFYVEVKIDNTENKISEITPFKSGERFDKYLIRIKID